MTAFTITFRAGRRTLAWTRYAADVATATESAARALAESYPRATLLSVTPA